MKTEIFEILKNQNFGFFEKCFENIFSKIELSLFDHKKFSAVTFEKINIFFTNPKSYEADCPWLPFPLLDIKKEPLRKKLSPKNLGGSSNYETQFRMYCAGFTAYEDVVRSVVVLEYYTG